MSKVATSNSVESQEFTSGSLLDQIALQTSYSPTDESYDIAKQGIVALISNLLDSGNTEEAINKQLVDRMIAELDKKMSLQIDEILHHPDLQKIESSWRGLKLLIDRTDFRENIKINMLYVTKEELLEDFEFAPEITQSGFYKHVYSDQYGQFGGEPIGAVIADYQFNASAPDMKLLQYVAAVGSMAHTPFLSAVSPKFFGIESYTELSTIKELSSIFEGPVYTKWRSLREQEDSRMLGLTTVRYLARLPYDPVDNPIKTFGYQEDVSRNHEHYLWSNSVYALATRLANSFAKYRWCPNIIGPQSGGAVEDLPVHVFNAMGELQVKIPTETLITDRREFELAEEGFIALTMRKGSDNAAFFSAQSVQKPKTFPNTEEGKRAETNHKLGTQLPYIMLATRVAHYLKVIQREEIGSYKESSDMERFLNTWLKQYVSDQENPPVDVRCRRPFRAIRLEVTDIPGEPGWSKTRLHLRPHMKFMGSYTDLSLVGRLDKE
ncbi:type VI secretion system contractile sheath large subunit [Frischella perrara]|jgi:type VI secretion protein, EvpB/VC_A0108 family|uniref:Type VI secretion protein n=1 Tax=Frischella perrara TaxID=1267021 RepID=A0A0A7S1X5_FRIPE|nr:type VI secretion system contractile sheath large subunit [Frischella perrara]AJA45560.1 type VI secretion protein [Frischella perrara]MCT6875420.1 type VI secretion system contractile sheath large subunit [Frischella perrara]PWV58987.1 type VI secretion system protein ImpC [Frischella perrara]